MNKFSDSPLGSHRGFTLVELIAVITLITIVLAFSLPRLDVSFVGDRHRKLSSWIVLNIKSLKENALREQSLFGFYLDFDNNQMWTAREQTAEASADADPEEGSGESIPEKESPPPEKYSLPEGYRLMDVAFDEDRKLKTGVVTIYFYPKGYSDKAIIHIRDADDNRYSYVIEPFMPHVKIHEDYIEF